MRELLKEWQAEISQLQAMEQTNANWDWKPVQERLERLHALAHELRKRKAEDRAKWQP